jgi:hypothetical protein
MMKVIGAGLPRTATLTQKVALEMLGLGPCYHMVNVFADLDQVAVWRAAFDGGPDWERTFDGFAATVDWPGGFFYRELADRYPEAKVLLSVRDPVQWERSMRETIWDVLYGDSLSRHLAAAAAHVNPRWLSYLELMNDMWADIGAIDSTGEDHLIDAMVAHDEAVKQTIAPERLLVWDVAEGWEPLCDFLGVDVPSAPLPHLNDSRTFHDRLTAMSLGMLNEWAAAQAQDEGTVAGAKQT